MTEDGPHRNCSDSLHLQFTGPKRTGASASVDLHIVRIIGGFNPESQPLELQLIWDIQCGGSGSQFSFVRAKKRKHTVREGEKILPDTDRRHIGWALPFTGYEPRTPPLLSAREHHCQQSSTVPTTLWKHAAPAVSPADHQDRLRWNFQKT
ncbi:hypothetical protein VTI74DRAFT_11701 [Chaetomium olivicolor]